jgi:hypothetical protein
MDKTTATLTEYEQNPALHLKKLYEFKVTVKKHYYGEDQEFLLEGVERKIKEVKDKIAAIEMSNNR